MIQGAYLRRCQRQVFAAANLSGKLYRAVSRTNKAADLIAYSFPEPPDLPIAALFERHIEPAIGTVTACVLYRVEMGKPIRQLDPRLKLFKFCSSGIAMDPYGVLANNLGGRMHKRIGQCAICREYQEPGGHEIQPADCDPS